MTTSETLPSWLGSIATEQRFPLVFGTVSGAHLYGFASIDSDVDLRGVHLLPASEVVGLRAAPETLQHMEIREGVELDLVTHDLLKFCRLLLRNNGYVAEQLLSPLVVASSALHEELVALWPSLVTKHHSHHYLGFAATQWKLFERNGELKPALYTLRVLLTGIHLMRTGSVVADLRQLWPDYAVPYAGELIEAKRQGEHAPLGSLVPIDLLRGDITRLRVALAEAAAVSRLPERSSGYDALHDLVVRARLAV
ncbi:nucleotidyltransferase [Rhizocola hellebori]|uniref:Nucleotidyltransferase n=1 Tax=Rhizocola hellebori TaxID=1392758 RepID=A0A8J3VI33_9ACTN|nr:nucleotidyltransferase domain-containing protein [Rhizocola hellebori]GIH06538.1 nucleotidyltransferase [Rhizocola hellebori]